MEQGRNSKNFENLKAKSSFSPLKVRSADDTDYQLVDVKMKGVEQAHSHLYVPSANLLCERRTVSESIGSPGVMKYYNSFSSPSTSCCHPISGHDTKVLNFPSVTFLPRQATAKNSLDEMPEGCCKLSQKTHNLLANENLSTQKSLFRSERLVEMNRSKSSHLQSPSTLFVQQNSRLKLKELSSGSNEESRSFKHVGSYKYDKPSSSADRNTLEIGLLNEEKSISGTNYVHASKDQNNWRSSSSDTKMKSSEEIGISLKEARSVNVNKQLLVLPASTSSADNNSPSSFRTRKLHLQIRPSGAAPPLAQCNLLENHQSDPELTNRWIKRLKLISSIPQGSKSSRFAEDLSHDKSWKNIRNHGKEPIMMDKIADNPTEDDNVKKKDTELLLSHIWIKRFQRNGDELNKKQFPSIAAMALVGRTMNGHVACELQKKGPITFWSTKTF